MSSHDMHVLCVLHSMQGLSAKYLSNASPLARQSSPRRLHCTDETLHIPNDNGENISDRIFCCFHQVPVFLPQISTCSERVRIRHSSLQAPSSYTLLNPLGAHFFATKRNTLVAVSFSSRGLGGGGVLAEGEESRDIYSWHTCTFANAIRSCITHCCQTCLAGGRATPGWGP